MKVLSVGNSFSVDCQRYVREIAAGNGKEITLGNLYIGGCSLERHCENMESGLPAYEYFYNNKSLGSTSLLTGLKDENWDVVTLQQASHFSGKLETYFPYIKTLYDYIKNILPNAEIIVNETWAYEYNSTHHAFADYNSDRQTMHDMLTKSYTLAAQSIGARLIPVGKAVSLAREDERFDPEKGGIALTRDGFHLSYSYGRYLAGLVWYMALTGDTIERIPFCPADYEYIGRDKTTNEPMYKEIKGTRADEKLLSLLLNYAKAALV